MTPEASPPSRRRAAFERLTDREIVVVVLAAVAILAVAAIVWLLSRDLAFTLGALGGLAVFFAAIQFADARRTIRRVEEIGGNLTESTERVTDIQAALDFSTDRLLQLREDLSASTSRLEGQLSTRWIGVFPDFLPQIVELVESATESVVIFCDFPAYGEFSRNDTFQRYAQAIRAKGELVSLLCLHKDRGRELTSQQVSKGGWGQWRASHEEEIREYLAARGSSDVDPRKIEHEDFVDLLAAGDERALEKEFSAARKWATSLVMPLYFWIVDDRRAVFALAPFVQEEFEVGFSTVDANLISALNGIFDRYRKVKSQTQEL